MLIMYNYKMSVLGTSRTVESKKNAITNEAEEAILFEILQDKFDYTEFIVWAGRKDADFYRKYATIDFKIYKLPDGICSPNYNCLSKYNEVYKIFNDYRDGDFWKPPGTIYIETKTRFVQNWRADGVHIMTDKDIYNFRKQYHVANGKIQKGMGVVKEQETLFCPEGKMEVFKNAYDEGIACYYVNYLNIKGRLGFWVAKFNPSWFEETKYPSVDVQLNGTKIYTQSYLIPFAYFKPIEEIDFSFSK